VEPKYGKFDPKLIEDFRHIPTTNFSDALTRLDLQAVRLWGILPLVPFAKDAPHMAGPAVTIRFLPCFYKAMYQESEWHLTEIVEDAPKGSVVVVEGGDLMPVQGELNCMTAVRSGHAGSVGDGPVRDADTLRTLGIPIFHKKSPVGEMMSSYAGALYCAAAHIPVQIAGALVRPGDLMVGDNHGVVVIPAQFAEQIRDYAIDIERLEGEMREKVRNGTSWRDIYKSQHKSKYFTGKELTTTPR
jgi:4-hydroxy-4-methyl-2-oxoglutarate aldolase